MFFKKESLIHSHASKVIFTAFGGAHPVAIFLAMLLLVLVGFATDSLRDILHGLVLGEPDVPWMLLIGEVLFFVLFVWLLYGYAKKRVEEVEYAVTPKERFSTGVIQSLSVLSARHDDAKKNPIAIVEKIISDHEHIDKTLQKLHQFQFNWTQNIVALHAAGPDLQYLGVITSIGKDGSHLQLATFKNLVHACFPGVGILETDHGCDFNDLDDCRVTMRDMCQRIERKIPRDSFVVLDITSGNKQISAAATMVSMTRGRQIAYVSNDRQVKLFEVDIDL